MQSFPKLRKLLHAQTQHQEMLFIVGVKRCQAYQYHGLILQLLALSLLTTRRINVCDAMFSQILFLQVEIFLSRLRRCHLPITIRVYIMTNNYKNDCYW